jgi:hypothetical protein
MDATPVVLVPFVGIVWGVERLFVKAPSGRQRLHGRAALHAMTHEVWTVKHLTSMTVETVCEWWSQLASAHAGIPLTIILDNARYQRCALVQTVANS